MLLDSPRPVLDTFAPMCPGVREFPNKSRSVALQWLHCYSVRFSMIQITIAYGEVKPGEATISILSQALHQQMKQFVGTQIQ